VPVVAREVNGCHVTGTELAFHSVAVGERRLKALAELVAGHYARAT
jgi:hypothetical protein